MRTKTMLAAAAVAAMIAMLGGVPSRAASRTAKPARSTQAPARWAGYHGAFGSGHMPLSGVADLGLLDPGDDADEAARSEAVPAGIVPALPKNYGPDVLVNQDLSATPHNETSVAVNPKASTNIVVGANDYRLGYGSSGFYATLDGGKTWHDGVMPHPTAWFEPAAAASAVPCPSPAADQGACVSPLTDRTLVAWDGGGDPSIAFDHANTAYYAEIDFHRYGCASGVYVFRSINGGMTWSRPMDGHPSGGDPRSPGDGVVVSNLNDNNCEHFYDKEWITTGPRPKDVSLASNADPKHISPDRLYATWTDFVSEPGASAGVYTPTPVTTVMSKIMLAYSDDQGRHFTAPRAISGSNATACAGAPQGMCQDDQGSVPVVDPRNGNVFVYFFNGDTGANPADQTANGITHDQLLVVSSTDGGDSFNSPVKIDDVADSTLPTNSSCPGGPATTLSNACYRWTPFGNISVDPRTGRLYAVWSDNRNGDATHSDVDVFVSSSADGSTWSPAARVNTDALKDGKDQFYPWAGVDSSGYLHVSFLDKAKDPGNHLIGATLCVSRDSAKTFGCAASSTGLWNPDYAFRDGLFIGDYTGLAAGSFGSFAAWPDARRAGAAAAGDNPPALFSDVSGSFATNFAPASVRGKWVDPRSLRPVTIKGAGVVTKPSRSGGAAWWPGALAFLALLVAGAGARPAIAARRKAGA